MLNYQKWKKLNEALGPATNLGISNPQSFGLIGSHFSDVENEKNSADTSECGCNNDNDLDEGEHMHDEEEVMHDDMDVDMDMKDDKGDEENIHMHSDMEDEDMEDEDMSDEDMEDMGDEDMEDEDMEDEDMEDEDMEDEDMEDMGKPEQLSYKKHLDMDHDMPENTKNKMGDTKMISEADWWKSVNNMIGVAAPNGKIIKEANGDDKEEKEDKEEKLKSLSSAAKPAVFRFEKALPEEKLKNITKAKVKSLLSELMSHILQFNKTMSKQNLKDLFRQVVNDYGAAKK